MALFHRIKKFILLISVAILFSLCSLFAAYAQDESSNTILKNIENNTAAILVAVDKLPPYMEKLAEMANSWLKDESGETPDSSSAIPAFRENFTALAGYWFPDIKNGKAFQEQLIVNLLDPINKNPKVLTDLLNVNDLSYLTLLGLPPVEKKKNDGSPDTNSLDLSSFNYIKNAAGFATYHMLPNAGWEGSKPNRDRYQNYFNTVVAVESFNGFVLGNAFLETRGGSPLTTTQKNLIDTATSADWFAGIQTKELGKLLREILMFNSQSYVLMSRLLELEKQLLTAQVMTNALLIASNQLNEAYMLTQAQGRPPKI